MYSEVTVEHRIEIYSPQRENARNSNAPETGQNHLKNKTMHFIPATVSDKSA